MFKVEDFRGKSSAANDKKLSTGVFRCASFKDINPALVGQATYAGGYGYNWVGKGSGMGYLDVYLKCGSLRKSSDMIMIGETADTGITAMQSPALYQPGNWGTTPPGIRHSGYSNFVFADGHVGSMKREQMSTKRNEKWYYYNNYGKK